MKRLILLSLVTLLCLPLAVYAASIGGVETQGQGKFSIGFDQEFVFDRDFEFDKANWDLAAQSIVVEKIELDKAYRTMIKLNYGVVDNLDVYVKLGAGDSKINLDDLRSGTSENNIYDSDYGFAYGVGLKGAFDLENNWLVGCDLQYLRQKADWTPKGDFQGEGDKITIQEWHIAPYVGYKVGNFIPYFGVRYSDLRAKTEWGGKDAGDWEKVKADDNFGVFLGTDYKIAENWTLNLEARFIDETAISFGTTYRF
ncbi:MAG: TonB-dependent receptor [Candidatus Omnitrophica bacterium]|nr:TonB-dependent receptor [Candidatus Omnitrophota bacterium]